MKLFICATLLLASATQTVAIGDLIGAVVGGVVDFFDGFKTPGTDVELLGCYQDGDSTCTVPEVFGFCAVRHPPRTFQGGFVKFHHKDVHKKCYEEALKNGVKTFAIQNGDMCFANDKEGEKHYAKIGKPVIHLCGDGRGGPLQNDVYHIKKATEGYKHIGCWKDSMWNRAVPELDGKDPTLKDPYQGRADAIHKCFLVAKKKGYKIFAVQHGGWCAGSADTEGYKKYGKATNCKDGKGGGEANDVYSIDAINTPTAIATPPMVPATPPIVPASMAPVTPAPAISMAHVDPVPMATPPKDVPTATAKPPFVPVSMAAVTQAPAKTIKHVDPVPLTPPKDVLVEHEKVASGRCESVSKEHCRMLSKDVYKNAKMKEGTRTYGKYPAGCYLVTSSGQVAFNADKDKKGTSCTAARNCLCPKAPAPPKPPAAKYPYAKNKDNLECTHRIAQGCFSAKKTFKRNDRKLLVYWRHDIEWKPKNKLHAFTRSLICTCSKAARAAGKTYFALHYWGECWAVSLKDFRKNSRGDCMRAIGGNCVGTAKQCNAGNDFMIYAADRH